MIVTYFSRHQRRLALFFLCLFYLQFALPVHANRLRQVNTSWPLNGATSTDEFKNIDVRPLLYTKDTKHLLNEGAVSPLRVSTTKYVRKFYNGPTQPEMQTFQSVNANNMVDLFTGDFSYNIPLLDVGGYPVNIHYSSGITMDQEASWVGLGWNINPGTITRNLRGLPDDFNGSQAKPDMVEKTLSMKPNKTIGVALGPNVELFGGPLTLGATTGVFHNNYKGWGTEFGINASINSGSGSSGGLTAGLGVTNNSQSGLDVSPSIGVRMGKEEGNAKGNITIGTNYNSRMGINSLQMTGQMQQQAYASDNVKRIDVSAGSFGGAISFSTPSFTPTITVPFTSTQFSFKLKVGRELFGTHVNGFIRGYGSLQKIADNDKTQALPAYGYLYYQNAKGNPNVLLDMNREKEMSYREKEPHIAVPVYTYDTYSISGEGTGGMFRPYRSDIGFIYDHAMSSKSNSNGFAVDLGFGGYFHGGLDYDGVYANTKNNPWYEDNLLKDVIPFRQSDSTFESVYFKNPGEKTAVDQSYYDKLGDTKLMRVDLSPNIAQNRPNYTATRTFSLFSNAIANSKINFDNNVLRKQRDKRTQVISYMKAGDAKSMALDTIIRSYPINTYPVSNCNVQYTPVYRVDEDRKDNHLSEIDVLNNDGRKYVYGIPVYNYQQKEVSFAVDKDSANLNTGQVRYDTGYYKNLYPGDNSVFNNRGIDNYYNSEKMPAYAHSFLLTGILSPDYIDITGDGISEDDNGEAIKVNYSRIYDKNVNGGFTWRAPFDSAAYNEGLKTDKRDQRASYSYGQREVWYMNSIESKTMMATFVLDVDSVRKDAYGVKNENGRLDPARKLYRLLEINLYAKSDLIKNGIANAKPVKTVHFEYSYDLCQGNPSSLNAVGKLTLKKIWFTYNNNKKNKLNPYVFTYHSNNPKFQKGATDRWGNYKDSRDNPAQLTNADYSYTLQTGMANNWDSVKAATNAAAWTLSKIKLPSGGELRMTYESDDYAFVQNKRAMQLFTIAGFGNSPAATPSNNLYYKNASTIEDYNHVFINVSEAVNSKQEIQEKYLAGITKIYFKLFVKVPSDIWGSGNEFVPFYAEIDNSEYGIKGPSGNKMIWVKLKLIPDGAPPAVAAIQFLRLNMPSKAYPLSEPGDNVDFGTFIKMTATSVTNIVSAVQGFGKNARNKNLCNEIAPTKSFVRLDNPAYKKLGGGIRVKKVEVFDNFNQMTGGMQQNACYGQEYDYSTIRMVNNLPVRISSGVAAYEPSIGAEENPFHIPIEFNESIAPLAPTNYKYTEEPLAETYFPGPMIGYSKVTVQTINKDKKSANGAEVTEFYTTYDFPVLWDFTPLDNESKKTFNPSIQNFFKFNARHNVTLSQGFRVELNDMNGKMKSQSSYAQNDKVNPLSYTYNYYKVDNENTLQKHLSGQVQVIDSANGKINVNGQLGKDIELMVDIREQTSRTIGLSVETNVDVIPAVVYPWIIPSVWPMPSSETNRYRSVAVLKVINRFGILDSVIHIEKGSKVSTKNMVYDSETGSVLLSRTNNEFDDPVYNFQYPAHWAYTGMGPAYKNLGATWKNVQFHFGKLLNQNQTEFNTARYMESGDELLVYSKNTLVNTGMDSCSPSFFNYSGPVTAKKVWAIAAEKGKELHKGLYFIDKNGLPFSATDATITIIRSGKRNLSSTPVGSVTSLQNPIRQSGGNVSIVYDTASQVINASATQFRDFWRVDSSFYRKDTTIYKRQLAEVKFGTYYPTDMYTIERYKDGGIVYRNITDDYLRAHSYDNKKQDGTAKSWLLFNLTAGEKAIPRNSVINSAILNLFNSSAPTPKHINMRGTASSNTGYLERSLLPWPRQSPYDKNFQWNAQNDVSTRIIIPETDDQAEIHRNDHPNVTGMVQSMVNNSYATAGVVAPAFILSLMNNTGDRNGSINQLVYNFKANISGSKEKSGPPILDISYCLPCKLGNSPYFSATPVSGYYCDDLPKDTFVCKPNIVDSAVNPYRWGILGNWRMAKAYTYYDSRKQIDPSVETNIRKDGVIDAFVPYWSFSTLAVLPSTDSNRWVWNSEMTLFNRKGFELENKDPLNRYNSGQYGYNTTMPVAVGQNSINREMAFDGFEDYNYRTDTCINCETPRFIDLVKAGGALVDTSSHTGKYSLRLNGNQAVTSNFKVVSSVQDSLPSYLSLKIDTLIRVDTVVLGNGIGLADTIYNSRTGAFCNRLTDNVNFNAGLGIPAPNCNANYYTKTWTGKIQPRFTDIYNFESRHNGYVRLVINGKEIFTHFGTGNIKSEDYVDRSIKLIAGKLYTITMIYGKNEGLGYVDLKWRSASGRQPLEVIPFSQLYENPATDASVSSTLRFDTTYCFKPRQVRPKRITLDPFSPLQGKQMVVTAWVKEDQACIPASYLNAQLVITFNTGSPSTYTLKPTGKIIEGWQRIEELVSIPASATTMAITLKSINASTPVYFDDFRMHPFNSNMKSFVYHPINLRLMAELDENNYATFYEYDDDGTLIRLKKETERGIKTIKETRSALLKD